MINSLRNRLRGNSPAVVQEDPSSTKLESRSASFSKTRRSSAVGDGASTSKQASNAGISIGSSAINKRKTKFYNKACTEKPTELFRTDLISNMTVADAEPLNNQVQLIQLTDTWRRDWNTGVQVPIYEIDAPAEGNDQENVNDGLAFIRKETQFSLSPVRQPVPQFREVEDDDILDDVSVSTTLKPLLPSPSSSRLLRSTIKEDETESGSNLESSPPPTTIGRQSIRYELDDLDFRWLRLINAELFDGDIRRFYLNENQFEKTIERLEVAYALRCADVQQSASFLRQKKDSDAVCDVCRGEFGEEGNLLVFCDRCDVCVHQACYGIRRVPTGPWMCRPCMQDLRPTCILCPNRGGAMKPTKSGNRWAHVSCAVWIPEIEFGNPSLKEPIAKISKIPEERWTLLCEICEQRGGACVQCNVRNCHISYHVTCAQRAGWKVTYKEMVPENDPTDVLESFCKKHSKNWPPNNSTDDNETNDDSGKNDFVRKSKISTTSVTYKLLISLSYLSDFEHVFDRMQEIPLPFRRSIFHYWKCKRLSAPEKILIFDIDDCQLSLERDREAEFLCRRVDTLISLRQTLEKTRTVCYMVERRERLKRQWIDTAAEEFRLLAAADDETGDGKEDDDGLKIEEFLKNFSMAYRSDTWLPKERKMTELFSLIPPASLAKKTEQTILKKKRGRPPTTKLLASGALSPLAAVNTSTPKRSTTSKKLTALRKFNFGNSSRLKSKSQTKNKQEKRDEDEDDDDLEGAHHSKRKRVPRVQYSPT